MKSKDIIGAAAMAAFAYAAAPAQAQDYFEGKTVTIIVGSGTGGTMDTNARQIALNIGKYIPGEPEIIVQNMPGGGGILATNYLYEVAEPDALTLYYGAFQPMAHLLELEELRADYTELELIGASSESRGVVMRTDAPPGISEPADLMNVTEIFVGGTSRSGSQEILNRMSLDLLGLDYELVAGYGSGSETRAALRRNEINFLNNSVASIRRTFGEEIDAGEYLPIYYFCYMEEDGTIVRNPNVTDIPCYIDYFQEVKGELPSGEVWDTLNFYSSVVSTVIHLFAAPPRTPEEPLQILRDAFYEAMEDPALVEFYESQTGAGPEVATIEQADGVFDTLANVSPEIVAVLRDYYAN